MNYETKEVRQYKGFTIDKAWRVDDDGKRMKKYPTVYLVADDDDYVGEEYGTLEEAKQAIDSWR